MNNDLSPPGDPEDPPTAQELALDMVGSLGAGLLGSALLQLLWGQLHWLDHGPRAAALGVVMLVVLAVASRLLAERRDGSLRTPRTAAALATLAWAALFLGGVEVGAAWSLPPLTSGAVLLAVAALAAAEASDGTSLGVFGALLLQAQVSGELAARLGLGLGFLTNAIFVSMGVGLGTCALGLVWQLRGGREGAAGMTCWGLFTVAAGLTCLSLYGHGYHGRLHDEWLCDLYYLLLVLACVAGVRVAGATRNGPLARMLTALLCFRVLFTWISWTHAYLPDWLCSMGAAVVLLAVAAVLIRVRAPAVPLADSSVPPPAPGPAGRHRALLVSGLAGAAMLASAAGLGQLNFGAPVKTLRVPVAARHLTPLLKVDLSNHELVPPFDLPPGSRVDVWWTDFGVYESDGPSRLYGGRVEVVAAGGPPPEGFDPATSLVLPGRSLRVRTFAAHPMILVSPRVRSLLTVPRGLRGAGCEGEFLELTVGRLGYPVVTGLGPDQYSQVYHCSGRPPSTSGSPPGGSTSAKVALWNIFRARGSCINAKACRSPAVSNCMTRKPSASSTVFASR